MNRTRLARLADEIERVDSVDSSRINELGPAALKSALAPERLRLFCMSCWAEPVVGDPACRTAGCIAGFAVSLFGAPLDEEAEIEDGWIELEARRLLDLDTWTADELFTPQDIRLGAITAQAAAAAIRRVIEHDETGAPAGEDLLDRRWIYDGLI